jgi:HlyD family secretion protein
MDRIAQQVDLKENQQTQERLDLENTLVTLQSQRDVQQLELDSRASDARRVRQLFDDGLASNAQLDQALVEEKKAGVQLTHLEEQMQQARRLTEVKLEGLAMEMVILRKELAEARRQLALATAASDREGVLTWIIQEEGVSVQKGQILARIADLSSFRIRANLSDVHAGRLSPGLPAVIRINKEELKGRVNSILPTISDGVISLLLILDQPDHPLLRSNLRVDVQIVTDMKEHALRLARGPAVQEQGRQQMFVVRGDTAVRVPVVLGISDFKYFEVVEGLAAGDEVILSDMKAYMHLEEVKIR